MHLVFPQIAKANLVRQQLQRERRQGHFPPPLPVLLVQERVWVWPERGEGRGEVEETEEVGPDVHGLVVEPEQAAGRGKKCIAACIKAFFVAIEIIFLRKFQSPKRGPSENIVRRFSMISRSLSIDAQWLKMSSTSKEIINYERIRPKQRSPGGAACIKLLSDSTIYHSNCR